MSVIGYEVDQVFNPMTSNETSVPIYWAYNHHYCAWLLGGGATLVKLDEPWFDGGGHPVYYKAEDMGDAPTQPFPTNQFVSEGNGGEFRKSYHGYPKGMAQLLYSPQSFRVIPMQIDTHNRDYHGKGFKLGPLPKNAANHDPKAVYSPILECPCSTRITKEFIHQYDTQLSGDCKQGITSADECFGAAASVQNHVLRNTSGSRTDAPPGCSLLPIPESHGFQAFFNEDAKSPTTCKPGGHLKVGGVVESLTTLAVELDVATETATITMTGPAAVWYGVGWNAQRMADLPNAIIVDGHGNVTERHLDNHAPGDLIPTSVHVVSNKVSGAVRTVVMTRPFKGLTKRHYTFDPIGHPSIPIINAIGSQPAFSIHRAKTPAMLTMASLSGPSCVCSLGEQKYINYLGQRMKFHKNCVPEPQGDLKHQHNPTCTLEQYQGGLSCCHHQWYLLDKDQQIPTPVDTYRLKFRFYYEPYVPATPSVPASHENLPRLYFQTEAWAGEYDVPLCTPGTDPSECVHMITAHFMVKDFVHGLSPYPYDGMEIIYAGAHCHAPSCISIELYDADNGQLLCRQTPLFGNSTETFNEEGYIAIPPCLWGSADEGLLPPVFLSMESNLTSIKRNNNTVAHYGEMASWQMRGVPANRTRH
eukprot:NODE_306_length_2266_cov_21.156067_g238_i0.p1 GENE.NODE_306_length_2266_cov_21.156067_g238_i0~~NODE_306_length_2266_cov_21.156067_g238_i0.p1  ORF type:complete len:721 (+),score=196.19 NODE_306_length_2266_cov_21.156067_g238_i0:236-2164(+)